MTSFQMLRKKTPFQKHREEEEARKKREDEEAAKLYEEFVESFEADDKKPKAFVRGGVIDPSKRVGQEAEAGKPKPGARYVPSFLPPVLAPAAKDAEPEPEVVGENRSGRPKVRNIDNFMEELRREQEAREERAKRRETRPNSRFDELPEEPLGFDPFKGSFDPDGDPATTNLYVGNLAPQIDESFLLRTFGRFGPIASVKIMWPRSEDEKRRARNSGFVAFMKRKDAEAAKDEMSGTLVCDYELKLGWGKAVPLPAQALPAPPAGASAHNMAGATIPPVGVPRTAAEAIAKAAAAAAKLALLAPGAEPPPPRFPDVVVTMPEDPFQQRIIDTVALFVLDDGCAFEQAIMERERGNPSYSFLFALQSSLHAYYRWRVFSFAQGDTLTRWRVDPFVMVQGGPRWVPPPLPEDSSDRKQEPPTAAAGKGKGAGERPLTDALRDEFEDMLRALTFERSQVRDAMGFALDNADAASEVVEVLTEALTLPETPIPSKVARLMLVSDILHNSSAPVKNASAYRTLFQSRLPDIFESFNETYKNITGRMTAEALKARVGRLLAVWGDWFLFSESFLSGLRTTFLRRSDAGVPPFHTLPTIPPGEDEVPPEVASSADGDTEKGGLAAELRALPLAELERQCKHGGLSSRGGRAVMVARLLCLDAEENAPHKEGKHDAQKKGDSTGGDTNSKVNRSRAAPAGQWQTVDPSSEPSIGWEQIGQQEQEVAGAAFASKTLRIPEYGGALADKAAGDVLAQSRWSEEGGGKDKKKAKAEVVLPTSKWAQEGGDTDDDSPGGGKGQGQDGERGQTAPPQEDEDLGADARSSDSDIFEGAGKAEGPEPTGASSELEEERRQRLRKLEVTLMEYRDSLEERGTRDAAELDRKVAAYRKRLEAEAEAEAAAERKSKESGSGRKEGSKERRTDSPQGKERKRARSVERSGSGRKRARSRSRSRERGRESRDSGKDKERGREREKEKEKERSRGKDRERERREKRR